MPLVKSVFVPIKVEGAEDAKLQIGRVSVAADELKRSNPTIEVQIDKAKALLEARLLRAGIQAELSRAVEVPVGADRRGGVIGRVLGGVTSGAAGGTGILGTIGGALGGLASAGPAGIAVLAGITVAAAAAATALGGAVAAIGAAGIGFAAFGALALPTLKNIVSGVSAVSGAANKVARDKAWDAIPKALHPAVQGVLGLEQTLSGFAGKIQPIVLQVVQGALKAARDFIPAILPIAQVAGKAIGGLLKGFDQFANSAGFKFFIAQMQSLAGPAITAIGRGIGQVVISVGKLLQQMANPQGVATLAILFKGIALAVGAIGLAFEGLNKSLLPFVSHSLSAAAAIVTAFKFVTDAVLGSLQVIIDGAAKAFGWIPGIGKSLRGTAAQFDQFKKSVDGSLSGARSALNRWSQDVANAPKVFALKANITDLQNKLATARSLLADRNLTATRRANIEANIANLLAKIAAAKNALAALNGTVATTYINTVVNPTTLHHMASGGVVGGAGGAAAPNLVMVGEMGRELVALPSGSRVYPHAQTERMMGAGAGATNIYLTVQVGHGTSPRQAAKEIADLLNQGAAAGIRLRKSILSANG